MPQQEFTWKFSDKLFFNYTLFQWSIYLIMSLDSARHEKGVAQAGQQPPLSQNFMKCLFYVMTQTSLKLRPHKTVVARQGEYSLSLTVSLEAKVRRHVRPVQKKQMWSKLVQCKPQEHNTRMAYSNTGVDKAKLTVRSQLFQNTYNG
jgi:hypothetical protein